MADNVNKTSSKVPKSNNKINQGTHKLMKRPPNKQEQGENVIYVNSNSNVKCLLERCTKLIFNEHKEIVIYCLGAAIKRGVLLALQITDRHCTFQISANTFTTELTDDLEPATDDVDFEIQKRQNSALRMVLNRVF